MAALYFRIQFKPTAGLSWECGMVTTELCHFSIINRYLVVFYLHSRGHSFKTAGKSEQVVICFQNKNFVMDKSAYERIQGKSTLFVWAKSFKMNFFFYGRTVEDRWRRTAATGSIKWTYMWHLFFVAKKYRLYSMRTHLLPRMCQDSSPRGRRSYCKKLFLLPSTSYNIFYNSTITFFISLLIQFWLRPNQLFQLWLIFQFPDTEFWN